MSISISFKFSVEFFTFLPERIFNVLILSSYHIFGLPEVSFHFDLRFSSSFGEGFLNFRLLSNALHFLLYFLPVRIFGCIQFSIF